MAGSQAIRILMNYYNAGGDDLRRRGSYGTIRTCLAAPTTYPRYLCNALDCHLATPTLLNDGWQPAAWLDKLWDRAQLITAAVPHYVAIGGWSMRLEDQGGNHKPLARHVAYWQRSTISILRLAWMESIDRLTDDPGKRKLGYGVCYARSMVS